MQYTSRTEWKRYRKGTTGCGATTLATIQKTPTIIAMPFVELIGNKAMQFPENDKGRPVLLPIYGEGDKTGEIREYMDKHGDLPKMPPHTIQCRKCAAYCLH